MDGGDEIGEKDLGIAIRGIETVPTDGQGGIVSEIHEETGFAIARRGGDEEQLAVNVFVQEIEQALAAQDIAAPRGQNDFCDEEI